MKTFDDLQSIWEDLNIKPYNHDGKIEITIMTGGDDKLVISISDKNDEDSGKSIFLKNVKIQPLSNNDFKITFTDDDNLNTTFLNGKHPINDNENIMILDIPEYGKRYFEKKSGINFKYQPINLGY